MERGSWDDILALAKRQGAVTPTDVRAMGLAPENLNKLAKLGLLIRSGRGVYVHPEYDWTENHTYVEIAKVVPNAVFCLLTALRIHDLGTQSPHQIWIAIPRDQRPPRSRTSLRTVRMSPKQYELGIESRDVEGVQIKVYSVEKTLVDCFRLRRLVGHDVAVEALRDALGKRLLDIGVYVETAKRLRADKLVMPYLEALTQ